jgi:hypothetical protein
MDFELTKRHVARGSKPDAEQNGRMYLFKKVSELRAAYQIRLLVYRAGRDRLKLIIDVPKTCRIHPSLKGLIADNRKLVELVKS